ncbi:MAG: hypothetical protein COC08_08535 [Maribacter sp.]|nr:MAG: hypothetical protein COC08_08535 [Maribacter sp.]
MGIFDRFKKKESAYDVTDIRVVDLDKNFIFDYDLSTWIVKAVYEYDWGDDCFTKEFKIENENETLFLNIDNDDELVISLTKKERIVNIDENLPDYIVANKKPPSKIEFEGKTFLLEEESPGYFNDWEGDKDNWIEFISWDYIDKSGEFVLSLEQWGERKFEASSGKIIKEFEISNIYPQKQD